MKLETIAHMRTDFPTKFGIPRQSGLVDTRAEIVFTPEFRSVDAVRGLSDFSHIWVIWQFTEVPEDAAFSPTVRPPRLGGNTRVGVFASRSPFRPNRLALSCLELVEIKEDDPEGPILVVRGADCTDGAPVFDIKPYLPYADSKPEAKGGFASAVNWDLLEVDFPEELLSRVPESKRDSLVQVLAQDPRPSFHDDPERIYGFVFAGFEIRFRVNDAKLTVISCSEA